MCEAERNEILIKRCAGAVAQVRDFVRLTVGRWGLDDYVPCLVASELAANAVRHGGSDGRDGDGRGGDGREDEVVVRLGRADDGALWLEVQDPGTGLPRLCEAEASDEGGRGLFIVEQLVRHWGVRPLAGNVGKVVFAVIDL